MKTAYKHEMLTHNLIKAAQAVLPVVVIILILNFTIAPQPASVTLTLLMGTGFIVMGITGFTMGADLAMTPMGDALGDFAASKKKKRVLIVMGVIMGFIITIAEPGLLVLADQAKGINPNVLVLTVAVGVGVFLSVAFMRTVLDWSLKYILLAFYLIIFVLSFFVKREFLSVAFDSGGATTGAMTVPFIMALGVAIAHSSQQSKKFGLIAICSIGPILTVMILGLIYTPTSVAEVVVNIPEIERSDELWQLFMDVLPVKAKEIGISLAPITLFFAFFKIFAAKSFKIKKEHIADVIIGIILTFAGLVLFLTGADVGFLPTGNLLGESLANMSHKWILIPIGMVIGFFMIAAEPAVHVLNKQVADVTGGAISKRAMSLSLSIGVATAIGLSMIRVITHIHVLWLLVPGYAVALGLSFISPKEYTAIAFDAGGVASGPLTSAFLLPLAIGASEAIGGNLIADAFGLIAMVALTPLITVQVLGLVYNHRHKRDNAENSENTEIPENQQQQEP